MNITSAHRRPSRSRIGSFRVIACALFAVVAGTASSAIAPATAAPDFTLHAMGGANLRLKEQRGRVVMVNFWATWCAPCRQEMPHLNRLYEKYRGAGFVLLGVNVDDDTAKAAEVAAKLGVTFPVLLDTDKSVSKLYDVSTMPSTGTTSENSLACRRPFWPVVESTVSSVS